MNEPDRDDDFPYGYEVELPPWERPKPIRVEVLIVSVRKGTFRPITEDDIEIPWWEDAS
jgi:hypothetical protein